MEHGAVGKTNVASTVVVGSDLGPFPRWTQAEYCMQFPDAFEVQRFKAMRTDGRNLVI